MYAKYKNFVIGTKERPTVFLMKGGEGTENIEDAQLFHSIEDGEAERKNCDEPEMFKLFDVDIIINGV